MKIWKWIVGLLAMLGGAAAVASTQNKKKKELMLDNMSYEERTAYELEEKRKRSNG